MKGGKSKGTPKINPEKTAGDKTERNKYKQGHKEEIKPQGMQNVQKTFCYKKSSEPIYGAPRPRYRSGIGFQVIKLHARHHICYIEQPKRASCA